MYAGKQPVLVLKQDCDCTAAQAIVQLNAAGYSVVRSFDLVSAQPICQNCQMIILLVYGQDGPPATLVFDGARLNTSIYLENDRERTSGSSIVALLSKIPGADRPMKRELNEAIDSPPSIPSCLCD